MVKVSPLHGVDKRDGARGARGSRVGRLPQPRVGLRSFFERRRTARRIVFGPLPRARAAGAGPHRPSVVQGGTWEGRAPLPRRCDFSLDDVYLTLTYLEERRAPTGGRARATRDPCRLDRRAGGAGRYRPNAPGRAQGRVRNIIESVRKPRG